MDSLLNELKTSKISKEIKVNSLEAAALEKIGQIHHILGNNELSFSAALNVIEIYQSLIMTESSISISAYHTPNDIIKLANTIHLFFKEA